MQKLTEYNTIYGAFSSEDAELYSKFSKQINNNSVLVEIGSFLGRSAICMSNFLIKQDKQFNLYCVDPFTGNPEQGDEILKTPGDLESGFMENTKSYRENGYIKVKKGVSLEVYSDFEDESIDFIFIDGLHDFKNVYLDLECWYNKIKPGGLITGHDFANRSFGVKPAVDMFTEKIKINYEHTDSFFWFNKPLWILIKI